MAALRKLCVVTGSRAEYGLLYWLMREIDEDPELQLQLVATGMHLSPEFGLTYREIENDGFVISEKVEMLLSSDTPVGIAKSMGLCTMGAAEAFARLNPDVVVLLGDRFETFAAAQAALVARIPIAHIHGGELTEGAFDDAMRHAVTKMAAYHFVAAEPYRKRVIQLGEDPSRVFNVGAIGLDNIARLKLLERDELERAVGFKLGAVNFLVTFHPVTLDDEGPEAPLRNLFAALDRFPDAKVIITKPNADTSSRIIIKMLDEYAAQNPGRVSLHTSLGQLRYLSAMKHADIMIGNSSSGLIEMPSFKKPTVNIGDRQKGRLQSASVISCIGGEAAITAAISKGLSAEFRRSLDGAESLYGRPGASAYIKARLKDTGLANAHKKKFYDL